MPPPLLEPPKKVYNPNQPFVQDQLSNLAACFGNQFIYQYIEPEPEPEGPILFVYFKLFKTIDFVCSRYGLLSIYYQ